MTTARVVHNQPWAIIQDFNARRSSNENKGGLARLDVHHDDLNCYSMHANLEDLRYMGFFFSLGIIKVIGIGLLLAS